MSHPVANGHKAIQPAGKARRLITPEHHGFPVGEVVANSMPGERRLGGYMPPLQLLSQKSEAGLPVQRVAGKLIGTAAEPL